MASENTARNRYMIIQAMRLLGVLAVVMGILMLRGRMAGPAVLGYLLVVVGLIDVFAVPQLLARRWRTPRE